MDKLLEIYNLTSLSHEKNKNKNKNRGSSINSKEIESVIKNSRHRRAQEQMVFLVSFTKYLKRINANLSQTPPKN